MLPSAGSSPALRHDTRAIAAHRAFEGLRFLFSAIPLVGGLIEPIAVLATDDGRRIGDRAARTQVIRASDYKPGWLPQTVIVLPN